MEHSEWLVGHHLPPIYEHFNSLQVNFHYIFIQLQYLDNKIFDEVSQVQEDISNQLLIGAAILNAIVLMAFSVSVVNFFIFLKNIKQLLNLACACQIQSIDSEKSRLQSLILQIAQDKSKLLSHSFNLKEKEKDMLEKAANNGKNLNGNISAGGVLPLQSTRERRTTQQSQRQ